MPEKRFIGVKELSEYLGVSVNTIRSWIWQRQIPYYKIGRLVKFDIRKIEDWVKEREIKPIRL